MRSGSLGMKIAPDPPWHREAGDAARASPAMPDAPTAATTTAPVSDREGTTRRVGRAQEPKAVVYGGRRALPEPPAHEAREEEPHQGAERRQQGLKLEREAIFEPPVSEAAGYLLAAHHTDHHCSVARQALDHDLPALRYGHLQRLGRPAPPRPVAPHGKEGIGMGRRGVSAPYAALGARGSWWR